MKLSGTLNQCFFELHAVKLRHVSSILYRRVNRLQEFINKVNLNTLGPHTFIYYLLPRWWLSAVAQVLTDTGLRWECTCLCYRGSER